MMAKVGAGPAAPAAKGSGMYCEKCKKQMATVHVTEIIKNQKTEKHLCEKCAKEEGVAMNAQISLQDVLQGMLQAHQAAAEDAKLACPDCGLTYAEFRNQGRLGCPHDYEAFREPLLEVLRRVHGSLEHVGKMPRRAGAGLQEQRELMHLRRRLQQAVDGEQYEEAARLRDLIKRKEAPRDA
jgi:protein arginine kinase activator